MDFALLTVDDHVLRIARALAAGGEHRVTLICDAGEHAGELLRLFPNARLENEWETLTLAGSFDRLIVGRAAPSMATLCEEQLRRLVQEGVATVTVHPAAEAIVMHELAMIQRDVGGLLAPWNPVREHAGVQRLLLLLRNEQASLGTITQVNWHRRTADATPAAAISALACDVDVLQQIAGKLDRVSAMAPASSEQSWLGLAVNFAGPGQALVCWTLQPRDTTETSDELTITATSGRLALHCAGEADGPWSLEIARNGGEPERIEGTNELAHHLAGLVEPNSEGASKAWSASCRAAELAEAVPQSLRRGRTIQLHYEEHSEQQTFKSVMAAGSCLLLLGLLMVVLVIAAVDVIAGPIQNPWFRAWRFYVFIPIMGFLLLQALWRVFATVPAKPASSSASEGAK
jgi:myo-inositol 2-dehydrogenase/D-chiro-inositol 1-dehydrogenase